MAEIGADRLRHLVEAFAEETAQALQIVPALLVGWALIEPGGAQALEALL